MSKDGVCCLTRLTFRKLYFDTNKGELKVQFDLTDPRTGAGTPIEMAGQVWSKQTLTVLKDLISSLEDDAAAVVLPDAVDQHRGTVQKTVSGIAEHLRSDTEVEDL